MNQNTVLFQFDPPPYKVSHPGDNKRHCKVEISKKGHTASIIIHELDDKKGVRVRKKLGLIAYCVHKEHFTGSDFVFWDSTKFYYQLKLLGRKVLFPIWLTRCFSFGLDGFVIPIPLRITR